MDELQLAKESEAIMQRGLQDLAERRKQKAEKFRLLGEVADLFQARAGTS